MDYMTLKETGEMWGVTPQWINYYSSTDCISGVIKMETVWLIQKNAKKSIDGRTKRARGNRNGK
ncbi:DNA-binding protein [Roseburia hominis]